MTFPAQLISYYTSQQSQTVAFNRFNTTTNVGVGTTFFTVPEGVTLLSAVCIGGGGGGSGTASGGDLRGSAGGGGGGLRWSVFTVQPGDILLIRVGYGGLSGAASATGNGGDGSTSSIEMYQRGATLVEEPIINAIGGLGGKKSTIDNGSGTAGVGGTGNVYTYTGVGTFRTILSGGGAGGSGGASISLGCGGGGAAGYSGNGGNGGSSATVGVGDPTAAAANSGGGGGGGGRGSLGFGGGGVGAFGFDGVSAGIAGTNGAAGGGGGSFFNDPGYPINASLIADVESTTTTLAYPSGLVENDFLLLLSGSDRVTGLGSTATNFTSIPVPVGFTTISKSIDSEYYVSSGSVSIETIPSNITPPTRDLNFSSSYRYVPAGGLTGSLTGLSTSSIHNLIALRYIPGNDSNPAPIIWANASGDPATNNTVIPLMPNPPAVGPIPSGAVSIAVGFLANTLLDPSGNTAGANTTNINAVSGGVGGVQGEGVGLLASYYNVPTGTTATFNPDPFLSGTAAHSRAYTIQINRSGGSAVGYVTSYTASTPSTSITIPAGSLNNGDLLVYACAYDNPAAPSAPTNTSALTWTNLRGNNVPDGNNGEFAGNSDDSRGGGGLGFRISYATYNGTTGISTTISGLTAGTTGGTGTDTPAAHMVIILRGATVSTTTIDVGGTIYTVPQRYAVWDNGQNSFYGPPDPDPITTNSNGAMVLAIGMIDNVAVSNVTDILPPFGQSPSPSISTSYSMLAKQSYGVQNNAAIIMSAIRIGLAASTSEDPTQFIGNGGNIWASQTIVIGGPGSAQLNGGDLTAGLYGGGGGSRAETSAGSGMAGADGAVRLIWGTGRSYPSLNQGVVPVIDWTP